MAAQASYGVGIPASKLTPPCCCLQVCIQRVSFVWEDRWRKAVLLFEQPACGHAKGLRVARMI